MLVHINSFVNTSSFGFVSKYIKIIERLRRRQARDFPNNINFHSLYVIDSLLDYLKVGVP